MLSDMGRSALRLEIRVGVICLDFVLVVNVDIPWKEFSKFPLHDKSVFVHIAAAHGIGVVWRMHNDIGSVLHAPSHDYFRRMPCDFHIGVTDGTRTR